MSDTIIPSFDMKLSPGRGVIKSTRILIVFIGLLLLLAVLLVWILPTLTNPFAPENAPMPKSAAIEDQYGIRISQVAVTADGGMIDFRYQVVDPIKAVSFAIDRASTPLLYPPASDVVVSETSPMSHIEALRTGSTYFLLYRNASGSINPQTYITVVIGNLKLERVPVR